MDDRSWCSRGNVMVVLKSLSTKIYYPILYYHDLNKLLIFNGGNFFDCSSSQVVYVITKLTCNNISSLIPFMKIINYSVMPSRLKENE